MVGKNIEKFRKSLSMSQRELGRRAGISGQMVSKIENGLSNPSIDTLKQISQALGVNNDALLAHEYFDREVFNRAFQLAIKQSDPGEDIFLLLGWYGGYDTLFDFYNHKIDFLPEDSLKGLLNYISKTSPSEYNSLYLEVISEDIYDLDLDLQDFCAYLFENTKPKLIDGVSGFGKNNIREIFTFPNDDMSYQKLQKEELIRCFKAILVTINLSNLLKLSDEDIYDLLTSEQLRNLLEFLVSKYEKSREDK